MLWVYLYVSVIAEIMLGLYKFIIDTDINIGNMRRACYTKALSTLTGDYSRRIRRQFVAVFGDSQFGDSRRFRLQSSNSAIIVASVDRA